MVTHSEALSKAAHARTMRDRFRKGTAGYKKWRKESRYWSDRARVLAGRPPKRKMFTVTTPEGKIETFRTEAEAETVAAKAKTLPTPPVKSIITVPTAADIPEKVTPTELASIQYAAIKGQVQKVLAKPEKYTSESVAKLREDWGKQEEAYKQYQADLKKYEADVVKYRQDVAKQRELKREYDERLADYRRDVRRVLSVRKGEMGHVTLRKFTVTYTEDGEPKTKSFSTETEADKFIKQQQDKIMGEQGFTGTWTQFASEQDTKQAALSNLMGQGLVKETTLGRYELTVPITVLTREQERLAKGAGFSIRELPTGPSWGLYQWGEKRFKEGTIGGELVEFLSAQVGEFTDALSAPYRFLAQLVPGEQYLEEGWKAVTPGTLKYVEDLRPGQQAALNLGAVASGTLGAYVSMLPVGLSAKGVTRAAGIIGSGLGRTTPAAIARIAGILSRNPKLVQAIIWAPIAGLEAHHVYTQFEKGASVDKIISDEARRIGRMVGSIAGLQAGYNLFSRPKPGAKLTRLVEVEEVRGPKGTILKPRLETKGIPKDVAEILIPEIDPITGQEIVVGWGTEAGTRVPIVREYGDALSRLMAGEAVGPDALKGAILSIVTPDEYGVLVGRGLDVTKMTGEEVAQLMYKELGIGTPWRIPTTEITMGGGTIDIVGALQSTSDIEAIGGLGRGKDLFNLLKSKGLPSGLALDLTREMMTAGPVNTIIMAKAAGVSEALVATIAQVGLTLGASTKGTQLTRNLMTAGLSESEVDAALSVLIHPSAKTVTTTVPKLDKRSLSIVMNALDKKALIDVLPVLDIKTLGQVIQSLSPETLKPILPELSTEKISELDVRTLESIVPIFDVETIMGVMPKLDSRTIESIIPKLETDILEEVLPTLDVSTLTTVIPKLDHKTLEIILPKLDVTALEVILPTLSTKIIETVLPSLDIPTIQTLLPRLQGRLTPSAMSIIRARIRKVPRRKELKAILPSKDLEPYEVSFQYPTQVSESFKVRARTFRHALGIATERRRVRIRPTEVEIEALEKGVRQTRRR